MHPHTHTHTHSSFPTVAYGSADALTINILLVLMMLLLLVCQRVSYGCLELKRPHENTTGVELTAYGGNCYPWFIILDSVKDNSYINGFKCAVMNDQGLFCGIIVWTHFFWCEWSEAELLVCSFWGACWSCFHMFWVEPWCVALFLRITCRFRTCKRPLEQTAQVKRTLSLFPDRLVC